MLIRCAAAAASSSFAAFCLERRLTPIGKFALLSETEQNPSVNAALLEIESKKPISASVFATEFRKFGERFHSKVDRQQLKFRQVSSAATQAVFEDDSPRELTRREWCSRALSEPFRSVYEWDARLRDEKFLFIRAHHCLADGVSLAALVGHISDQSATIGDLVRAQKKKFTLWKKILFFFYFLFKFFAVFANLLTVFLFIPRPFTASRQSLRCPPYKRNLAWVFLDLEEMKTIAQKHKGTLNDLFAAMIAGALKKTTPARDTSRVCAAVPVHLYGGALTQGNETRNAIGAVLAPLPLSGKIQDVTREFGGTVRGGVAHLYAFLAATIASTVSPRDFVPSIMQFATSPASIALTNVRGPPFALTMCNGDYKIKSIVPFIPPPPNIPIGCAILTYDGQAVISANVEDGFVDPHIFLQAALDHYDSLKLTV